MAATFVAGPGSGYRAKTETLVSSGNAVGLL